MTLTKSIASKQLKVFFSAHKSAVFALTSILLAAATISQSIAQEVGVSVNACSSGYAETWIVGQSCFVGQSVDVKTDDAIHVSCNADNAYSIAFFVEPAGTDPATSNAIQYDVCPGNGHITTNVDGEEVLRCNFWESSDNVAKQIDIQLQPAAYGETGRSMNWKVSELDNPNVVCGVSGRPGEEGDTAGSGHTS